MIERRGRRLARGSGIRGINSLLRRELHSRVSANGLNGSCASGMISGPQLPVLPKLELRAKSHFDRCPRGNVECIENSPFMFMPGQPA